MQKLSGTCSEHVQATLNGQAVIVAEQSLAIQAKVGLIKMSAVV
jgi:hypothetical protein